MKKTITILKTMVLASAILLSSCKKDGANGKDGKDGNANVLATTFSVPSWSWSSPYHYVNLSVPDITSANLNSAAVMVYFSTGSGNWSALPYTQYNSPYDYFMGFNTSVGKIQVTWFYDSSLSSGSDPNTYYSTTIQCKVVVIPPAARKANVDHRSYEEVKKAYNIID